MTVLHPNRSQLVLQAIGSGAKGYAEINAATGFDCKQINSAIYRLKGRDFIARGESGYALTEAGRSWLESSRVIAAGQGKRIRKAAGLRERAWWLMREIRQFTLNDLLMTLASGAEKDAESNLRKYINALEAVGVLRKRKRRQGGILDIWRVTKDLGRKAPVRRGVSEVFDPNSGQLLIREENSDE